MKLLFAFLLGVVALTNTATTFEVVESSTNKEAIKKNQKVEKSEILIRNTANEPVQLGWKRKSNTLLEEWDYSVCAYGECSIGVPGKGKFKALEAGEEAFFALHLFPRKKTGNGKLEIEIYDLAHPDLSEILTFIVEVTD
ncbi:MAG: hypothetical protein MI810_04705 [Flavobacteriales bacterium]|nr:hypothetical protein [Flavobacteriales bacterium]